MSGYAKRSAIGSLYEFSSLYDFLAAPGGNADEGLSIASIFWGHLKVLCRRGMAMGTPPLALLGALRLKLKKQHEAEIQMQCLVGSRSLCCDLTCLAIAWPSRPFFIMFCGACVAYYLMILVLVDIHPSWTASPLLCSASGTESWLGVKPWESTVGCQQQA